MQIMIEIPDGYVGVIIANQRMEGSAMDKLLRQAVIDGVQLPKGHGNLIDVDDIKVIELEDGLYIIRHEKGDDIDVYIEATTVIEADKEDKE